MSGAVRDALEAAAARLRAAGVPSPEVDAEHLLAAALGVGRAELRASPARTLGPLETARFEALLARRAAREPLQYVLGEWGFRRLTLAVDARALVPRPETEALVERCLALLAGRERPAVLDVGTGSGAIALAIADEHPGARVTGIDASEEALSLARENAARTGLAVELRRHDLFDGLPGGPWDLVASNPPYVGAGEIEALEPEVRDHEPRAATVGAGHTEALVAGAWRVLRAGGALVLETHADEAAAVAEALRAAGYARVRVSADLAGRDRVVEGVHE